MNTAVDTRDGLPLTVGTLLRARAEARGDHPLLVCDDAVLTYAQAADRSGALARGLYALGTGPGTHVGLLYPNGPDFVVGWLATARLGAVTVPISTFSTGPELRTLLRNADVAVLLAARRARDRDLGAAVSDAVPALGPGRGLGVDGGPLLDPALPVLRRVVFDPDAVIDAGDAVPAATVEAIERTVTPGDRMVIVHTSGSTSEPKGVIHQHGPLIRHLDGLNRLRRYTAQEVLFSNSPFFWIGGFAYSLLGTLLAGATLVCSNASVAAATLDLLERTRPTIVNGFAASVAHLARDPSFPRRDLRSIRRGNLWPIMPDDVRPADPELRHNMLGMTETGSVCLASDDEGDQPERRRGSFGRPVPGFEARVVDPENGRDCAPGVTGELWLRGPFLMEGYYGRERHETFTADGWFRTGDLVHVDDEGFHYFHGRLGDMIKTAGANVSPREVEAAIAEVSGIVAHVVGVEDPERGQIVAAVLRVPDGGSPPDTGALRAALARRLSSYKVPRRFVVVADRDVPMLSSGKVDAQALRELARRG